MRHAAEYSDLNYDSTNGKMVNGGALMKLLLWIILLPIFILKALIKN